MEILLDGKKESKLNQRMESILWSFAKNKGILKYQIQHLKHEYFKNLIGIYKSYKHYLKGVLLTNATTQNWSQSSTKLL